MLKKNRGSKRKTEYVCVERERERESLVKKKKKKKKKSADFV